MVELDPVVHKFASKYFQLLRKIPSPSSPPTKSVSRTSCCGIKKARRDGLLSMSRSVGVRNETPPPPSCLVQKMTMLVKSRPALAKSSSSRGCSRKRRQVGKTDLMVLRTMRGGGRAKSPA